MLNPSNFKLESTSMWSFQNRGSWATHSGQYRGNWSPYIPRNIIVRYSKENDWVLDQFVGSGTTLIEAKLLNRNAIGIDVNPKSIEISKENLNFDSLNDIKINAILGDARKLNIIEDNSIDLICTHPPYANIIKYSNNALDDLSSLSFNNFVSEMNKVAEESYRVLKKSKICAIMMGDMRCKGNIVPLGFKVMNIFIEAGFNLKEIIIKEQHNCKSTYYWKDVKRDFLLIAHEYIFILNK